MLKVKTCLSIIILSSLTWHCLFSQNYQKGDSLVVWAKSGLILRKEPNKSTEKLLTIPYGGKVEIIDDTLFSHFFSLEIIPEKILNDTIRFSPFYLDCNWIKVKFEQSEGYVYDAYLSKIPPFQYMPDSSRYENIQEWLVREFGVLKSMKKQPVDADFEIEKVIYRNGAVVEIYVGNWASEQIIFPEGTLKEGFLMFDFLFDFTSNYNKECDKDCPLLFLGQGDRHIKFRTGYPEGESEIWQFGTSFIISWWFGC